MKAVGVSLMALACLTAWRCASTSGASTQRATEPGGPVAVAASELDPGLIEGRIRQVEGMADRPPAVRAELLSLYGQALEQLKVAATWAEQSDRLREARERGAEELGRLRARLDRASSQAVERATAYVSPDVSLEVLLRRLQDAEAELKARREILRTAEDVIIARSDRRMSLPAKLADTNAQLVEVNRALDAVSTAGGDPDVAAARRIALLARRRAIEMEGKSYDLELSALDAIGTDLLTARRDVARLDVAAAQANLQGWEEAVARRRSEEITRQQEEASRQLAQAPQGIRKLAEQNQQLAEERKDVNARITEAAARTRAVEETIARLDSDLRALQEKLKIAGRVADVGPVLTRQKAQLPDIASTNRERRAVENRAARIQIRLLELEEEKAELDAPGARVGAILDALRQSHPGLEVARVKPDVEWLVRARREALNSLAKDYEAYWNGVIAMGIAVDRLATRIEAVLGFINENVLWLPSDPPVTRASLPDRLRPPAGAWGALRDGILMDILAHPFVYGAFVMLVVAWCSVYPWVRRRRMEIDRRVCHVYSDSFGLFAVAAILRYIIVIVGIVLAFGAVGVQWSQVQWLAAAVTVGLGFGLQEIFANFVAGLILLFERPIRIGDTVTVGDISGTVSRIQIRATTIMGWNRKELIIPNKEFVTGKVINWTLSDSVLRLVVPVGVAYGSDTGSVQALLREVARQHPLVLKKPEPVVLFGEFGESALNFELRVFIGDIDHLVGVRHDLHLAIDAAFRKAGIEIAFPQRDIHIRTCSEGAAIVPVASPVPPVSGAPDRGGLE